MSKQPKNGQKKRDSQANRRKSFPPIPELKSDIPHAKHKRDSSWSLDRFDTPETGTTEQNERRPKKSKTETEGTSHKADGWDGIIASHPPWIRQAVGLGSEQTPQKLAPKKSDNKTGIEDIDIDEVLDAPLSSSPSKSKVDQDTPQTEGSSTAGNSNFTEAREEEQFERQTCFLVCATSQEGVAPVLVPFRRFRFSSDFINSMGDECGLREWGPTAQLSQEISNSLSSAVSSNAPLPRVMAASVTIKWSGFTIRVRPGKDADWKAVVQEVQRGWSAGGAVAAESVDDSGNGGDNSVRNNTNNQFQIAVMLHVAG